jgi:hypothetical protein
MIACRSQWLTTITTTDRSATGLRARKLGRSLLTLNLLLLSRP